MLDISAIWFWSSSLPVVNAVAALLEVTISGVDAGVSVVLSCMVYVRELCCHL